jgi:hypothetical protein
MLFYLKFTRKIIKTNYIINKKYTYQYIKPYCRFIDGNLILFGGLNRQAENLISDLNKININIQLTL